MRKKLLNDQGLVHILKRYVFLAALLLVANVWGQTVSYTFSSLGASNVTAPTINLDSNIRLTSNQNSGTTNTSYNAADTTLRSYYQSSGSGNGGGFTLTSPTGATITKVILYSNTNPTVKYNVDSGSDVTATSAGSYTYTISGVTASSSFKIRNANTSNTRLDLTKIDVTYTLPGITSATSGNWADGTTWVGGVVPTSSQNVTIASGHTVTATSAGGTITRNSGTTTTVTGTLETAATYTNDGTTTINGVFQINAGGYANGTNNLIYGTAGTLIFNHSNSSDYGVSGGSYWPSTNGPVNVTLNANSPVNLGLVRTVTGIFTTSAVLKTASNLTVNGTNQINSVSASFDSAVNYGASSTLLYNSGSTFNRGNEWNNSPNNVTLQNSTILNYPNGWGGNFTRTLNGNLSVGTGSALYMDYGSPGTGVGTLTVKGNVLANGNISLGNQSGGDLVVGGNFTNTATFNANGRKVTFNGSVGQSITGATTFAYLEYNSSAGTNVLTVNNDITVSNELRFTTGLVSLASGVNVNIANNASVVATSGNFNSASTNGKVNFLGTGTTTGTINFYPAVVQAPSSLLGVSYSAGSTIQGTLTLNSNSYVASAPKYAAGSTLVYNNTGTYARGVEWGSVGTTFPANGYPHHVTVQNGTVLNIETGWTGTLRANGNLNLGIAASGAGSLNMQNTGNALEIKGNVNLGNTSGTSTLTLSTNVGGDLSVGGNWVKNATNGVLISNNRAVTFNGTTAQTLTGATTFDYLTINNSAGLTLNNAVNMNQALNLTLGKITLGTNDFTIAASGSISGGSTSNYIVTNSTGVLKWLAVGNADKTFPVGKDTSYYAPVTIKNTTGTSDLSVRVNSGITNAVYNPDNVITQEWLVNSSAATVATITPAWAGAKQPGTIANPGSGELGNYSGSAYAIYPTSLVATPQNQTTVTNVAIAIGNNYIVVGSTGAVYTAPPANDTCGNAIALIVNDPVTHGTLNGATKTGSSTYPDVFYKFTPSVTGTYTITINNFSTGDRDLYVYTSCPSAIPGSVASGYSGTSASTTSETITNTFASGTTYYIAVYDYATARGTFDIRVTANPVITATPTSIAFGTVNLGSATSDSFNLSAELLTVDVTPANNKIVVTAPTGYKVSLNNTIWSTSVDVPYTTSSLASTPIYVIVDETTACGSTVGNITFATANLVTSPTVALTATLAVPTPTAIAATDETATTFTAQWATVTGATGYVLDVSMSPTFGTTAPASSKEEFESTNVPTAYSSASNYNLGTGVWNLANAGYFGTASNNSTRALQLRASNGIAISPAYNAPSTITFWARIGSTLTLSKIVGGVTTALSYTPAVSTGNWTLYTCNVNETNSSVQIQFANGSSTSYLEDVTITYSTSVPSFVSPYNNYSVGNVTSTMVSGLSNNSTYYYRLRAVTATCSSSNSNTITASTNNSVIWNSNAWSNTTGPTSTLDAIVRDNYSTATTGNFTVKDLTVESMGNITIGSGDYVKVEGVLTINNNIAKDNFVILTGGNLLQTSTAANNVNGIIQAQRSVTGINNNLTTGMDYIYWSSPVSGQRTNTSGIETGFSPGTPANRFYEYNESKDTFKATADAYFTAGKGYAVRAETGLNPDTNDNYIDGYAKIYKFNGVPNNGDITFGLTRTQAGAATAGVGLGFNMIGNPYPSNINFEELYAANSSVIYNTAYFWTNNVFTATQGGAGYAQNNYAVYNGVGGNPASEPTQAPGDSGDNTIPDGIVSVGQGFIVQAKIQGSSSLSFKNSYSAGHDLRLSGNGHFFQKQSSGAKSRFWIKLKSPNGLTNTQLIGYVPGASNGFEQDYDAEALSASSDVFYSILGSRQLLIQGRSENFITSDIVPVGANFYQDGMYSIGLDKVEGIFENGQKVYLRDNLLGKTIDLSQGDYRFSVNKGLNNTRFDIVYKESGVLDVDGLSKSDFTVYRDGTSYVVKSTKKLGKIEVYDASGRMMRDLNSAETMIRIDMSDFSNGVYILKVENSGEIKTKKIIK